MLTVSVSYAVYTHESVENGDADERGFMYGGVGDFAWPIELSKCDADHTVRMSGRDAARLILEKGCIGEVSAHGDCADFYPYESQHEDFRTGDRTEYVVHVRGDARLIAALARHVKR